MNKVKKYFILFCGSLIFVFPPFHELIHCIIDISTGQNIITHVNWWSCVYSGRSAMYLMDMNQQMLAKTLNNLWELSVFVILIPFIILVYHLMTNKKEV